MQVRCRECEAAFATGLLAEAGGRRVVARVVVSCPACRACAAYGPDDFLLT